MNEDACVVFLFVCFFLCVSVRKCVLAFHDVIKACVSDQVTSGMPSSK